MRNRYAVDLHLLDFFDACDDALGAVDLLMHGGAGHVVDGAYFVFCVSLSGGEEFMPVLSRLASFLKFFPIVWTSGFKLLQ